MRRVVLSVLCLMLLASCAKQAPSPPVIAGEESETVTAVDLRDIAAAEMLDEAQIVCTAKMRDGGVYGFEMRFPRTQHLHELFSDAENLYYGVVSDGGRLLSVPMEQIRILTDETTREFVITLLLSEGDTAGGGKSTVSFYVAPRDGDPTEALFGAQKTASAAQE